MLAKTIGAVAGIVVFFGYFAAIGTKPVFETLLGVVLALAIGAWAWWETDRRMARRKDGPGK